MRKKLFISLFSIVACLCNSFPVFADASLSNNEEITTLNGIESKALDELLRYVPCSGGGKHSMYGRGPCTGYKGSASGNNSVLFEGGIVTQCSKCQQVLATEQNPYWNPTYLGWYTMVSGWHTDIGTGLHKVYANDWTYNSNWASDEFFRSFNFYKYIL